MQELLCTGLVRRALLGLELGLKTIGTVLLIASKLRVSLQSSPACCIWCRSAERRQSGKGFASEQEGLTPISARPCVVRHVLVQMGGGAAPARRFG